MTLTVQSPFVSKVYEKSLVTLPVGAVSNVCSPGVYTKSGSGNILSRLASHFHVDRLLSESVTLAVNVSLSSV